MHNRISYTVRFTSKDGIEIKRNRTTHAARRKLGEFNLPEKPAAAKKKERKEKGVKEEH